MMGTNIIQFRPRAVDVGYKPGVPPFDINNAVHIDVWNWAIAFITSETRSEEKSLREQPSSIFAATSFECDNGDQR